MKFTTRSRTLGLLCMAALGLLLAGCCGTQAASAPAAPAYSSAMSADPCAPSYAYAAPAAPTPAIELEPVVAQPVRGICLPIPLTGCKFCLGFHCDAPLLPLPEAAVFGTPVRRAGYSAPAAAPCGQVYAAPAPCVNRSGSASDGDFVHGMGEVCEYRVMFGTNTINGPSSRDYEAPPAGGGHDVGCGCPNCTAF